MKIFHIFYESAYPHAAYVCFYDVSNCAFGVQLEPKHQPTQTPLEDVSKPLEQTPWQQKVEDKICGKASETEGLRVITNHG